MKGSFGLSYAWYMYMRDSFECEYAEFCFFFVCPNSALDQVSCRCKAQKQNDCVQAFLLPTACSSRNALQPVNARLPQDVTLLWPEVSLCRFSNTKKNKHNEVSERQFQELKSQATVRKVETHPVCLTENDVRCKKQEKYAQKNPGGCYQLLFLFLQSSLLIFERGSFQKSTPKKNWAFSKSEPLQAARFSVVRRACYSWEFEGCIILLPCLRTYTIVTAR